jgi:hypothetical protein
MSVLVITRTKDLKAVVDALHRYFNADALRAGEAWEKVEDAFCRATRE